MASADTLLELKEVAQKFGVDVTMFKSARPFIPGFPEAITVGKKKCLSLAALDQWAEGKDPRKEILQALYEYRSGNIEAKADKAEQLKLSRRFFAGEFDTEEQRYFHSIKRWTARDKQPKTTTVHIRPIF